MAKGAGNLTITISHLENMAQLKIKAYIMLYIKSVNLFSIAAFSCIEKMMGCNFSYCTSLVGKYAGPQIRVRN